MTRFKKAFPMIIFVGIIVAMLTPMAAALYNVQSLTWSCQKWVDGDQTHHHKIFDKGTVELSGSESCSGNSGTVTAKYELRRIRESGAVKSYGIRSNKISLGTKNRGITYDWSTDCLCQNYYFYIEINPYGYTLSGSASVYNK